MRVVRIDVRAFGGLSDCRVDLRPGMNVVLGDNETGKSTIYRALQHTLLTPTNLDKRRLAKELGPCMPQPEGNAAESAVTLEREGEHVIRRRWGEDAEEEYRTPDGTLIRGAAEVTRAIERTLPVTPATFRTVFLADQSQLDRTIDTLADEPGARDEAAAVLRSIRLAAGGVSPDAFGRLLDERINALTGRWDAKRNQPQDGRGFRNPWTRGAGDLVKTHYAVKELEARLAEVVAAEQALDAAQETLERASFRFAELAAFTKKHEPAFRELAASRGLESEIARLEERRKRLREANRSWPVALRDSAELAATLQSLQKQRVDVETELALARARDEADTLGAHLSRVDSVLNRLAQAEAERDDLALPDPEAVEELRSVEAELPYAEAKLASGSLRVAITADPPREIAAIRDEEAEETFIAGSELPARIAASRHVELTADGLTVRIEAGEEPFDQVRSVRDTLRKRRDELCASLEVRNAAEADARKAARLAADKRVAALTIAVAEELEEDAPARFRAARDELASRIPPAAVNAAADAPGDVAAGRTAARASASELAEALGGLREESARVQSRLEQAQAVLAALTSEYGDQDRLENDLGETSRALSELRTQQEALTSVPEGFSSVGEFLAAFERNAQERQEAHEALSEARVAYAELVGNQPEQTSDEVRQALTDATARFERLRRDAQALMTVRERSRRIVEELDAAVFDPFAQTVAGYIAGVTGSSYSAHGADDPLAPARYLRDGGPVLPYDLLSQGTRDSLALAVRLALAQTVLRESSAPMVLDDPFVDMDPTRRHAAAAVVKQFAATHQVILFTCHPDHAALFEDANVIILGESTPS